MSQELPFSQSCENNKQAILDIFQKHLPGKSSLLELAGGTGQHAVFFSQVFPELTWQSSDIPGNVGTLNLRLEKEKLPRAITIDANDKPWFCESYDVIFTANSLHIMSASSVENLFEEVENHIVDSGLFIIYGPFKYGGDFTSESNGQFDLWLKDRNPKSGVRDFEWISKLAQKAGLELLEDNAMPANNQMLVFKKSS